MAGRDRHPPGRDCIRAQLAKPTITEFAYRLRQQPTQLGHGLRLATVLGEIHIDELAQLRRLDQAPFGMRPGEWLALVQRGGFATEQAAVEALERALERLRRVCCSIRAAQAQAWSLAEDVAGGGRLERSDP